MSHQLFLARAGPRTSLRISPSIKIQLVPRSFVSCRTRSFATRTGTGAVHLDSSSPSSYDIKIDDVEGAPNHEWRRWSRRSRRTACTTTTSTSRSHGRVFSPSWFTQQTNDVAAPVGGRWRSWSRTASCTASISSRKSRVSGHIFSSSQADVARTSFYNSHQHASYSTTPTCRIGGIYSSSSSSLFSYHAQKWATPRGVRTFLSGHQLSWQQQSAASATASLFMNKDIMRPTRNMIAAVHASSVGKMLTVGPTCPQRRWNSSFKPLKVTPYGIRSARKHRKVKMQMRRAAVRARKTEEAMGFLLDPKKCFQMEIKRNTGIGWFRSMQVMKHLEMHVRAKGPPVNLQFREKIAKIAKICKHGK